MRIVNALVRLHLWLDMANVSSAGRNCTTSIFVEAHAMLSQNCLCPVEEDAV